MVVKTWKIKFNQCFSVDLTKNVKCSLIDAVRWLNLLQVISTTTYKLSELKTQRLLNLTESMQQNDLTKSSCVNKSFFTVW